MPLFFLKNEPFSNYRSNRQINNFISEQKLARLGKSEQNWPGGGEFGTNFLPGGGGFRPCPGGVSERIEPPITNSVKDFHKKG